jgi:predicted nucleotidyltransferase
MHLIVEMRYGSHLFGTATPQSDIDLKGVYLPKARDILLQRVKPSHVFSPPKARGQKNSPGDVDREIYSLQRFLSLLAEGQTTALDMLFAPDSALTMQPGTLWQEIRANPSADFAAFGRVFRLLSPPSQYLWHQGIACRGSA